MKCYYAHPLTDYGTWREMMDVKMLEAMGFEVLNPNNPVFDTAYKIHGMNFFLSLVDGCDMVAFRPFIDGKLPAGVAKEVYRALDAGLPVIELPAPMFNRVLTVEETRTRIMEGG